MHLIYLCVEFFFGFCLPGIIYKFSRFMYSPDCAVYYNLTSSGHVIHDKQAENWSPWKDDLVTEQACDWKHFCFWWAEMAGERKRTKTRKEWLFPFEITYEWHLKCPGLLVLLYVDFLMENEARRQKHGHKQREMELFWYYLASSTNLNCCCILQLLELYFPFLFKLLCAKHLSLSDSLSKIKDTGLWLEFSLF